MTATDIRIMEESAENKTFERIVQGSVCINRSDRCNRPVRPIYMTCMVLCTWTNQSDRWIRSARPVAILKLYFTLKLGRQPLNQSRNANLKTIDVMMHDMMHNSINYLTYATKENINSMMHGRPALTSQPKHEHLIMTLT